MAAVTQAHDQAALNRLGLGLFLASEAFLFGVLYAARFSIAGTETPAAVSQPLGVALTIILLASSGTAHRAQRALERGDPRGFRAATLATIGLGAAFLVIVGFEWAAALGDFAPRTPYGSAFLVITGTHALHLFLGLMVFTSVLLNQRTAQLTEAGPWWGSVGAFWYWHFVDGVWLTVFTVLYLVGGV